MRLPQNVTGADVTSPNSHESFVGVSGVALLLGFLTGLRAPATERTDESVISNNLLPIEDSDFSSPPLSDSGTHYRPRRSAEGISPKRSRHWSTHGVKLRPNSDFINFLHIDDGSVVVGSGQMENNSLCMRKHKFRVTVLASGEFVVMESQQGGEYLSENDSGIVGVHTDASSDVTSATRTDNRFFRIFKKDEGDAYYVIQNMHSGRYLHVENGTVSTVTEEELETSGTAVQFDMFDCDVTSG
ncbi:uncharacterized protein LOC135198122 [Macrobrachium nipponense]|uniref:uncharacterized protein LOC135198122 n=1 Tax=Macrobrachium nipponense TaxID=159736 RepID=UPI0030C8A3D4